MTTPTHRPYQKGDTVRPKIGDTSRRGVIVRQWVPWSQFQIRWENGSTSSLWHLDLELIAPTIWKWPETKEIK